MKQKVYKGIHLDEVSELIKGKVTKFKNGEEFVEINVPTAFTRCNSRVIINLVLEIPTHIRIFDECNNRVIYMKKDDDDRFRPYRYEEFKLLFYGDQDFHSTDLKNMIVCFDDYYEYEGIELFSVDNIVERIRENVSVIAPGKEDKVSDETLAQYRTMKKLLDEAKKSKDILNILNSYLDEDDQYELNGDDEFDTTKFTVYVGNYQFKIIVVERSLV